MISATSNEPTELRDDAYVSPAGCGRLEVDSPPCRRAWTQPISLTLTSATLITSTYMRNAALHIQMTPTHGPSTQSAALEHLGDAPTAADHDDLQIMRRDQSFQSTVPIAT